MSFVIGSGGWIRTSDQLINSQQQTPVNKGRSRFL